jgi:hypothetical protein
MAWALLVNCSDEFEAALIMGALKEEGIPSMTKYRSGSGDYLRIITGVGKDVDILVPAEEYSRAKSILESLQAELEPEQ